MKKLSACCLLISLVFLWGCTKDINQETADNHFNQIQSEKMLQRAGKLAANKELLQKIVAVIKEKKLPVPGGQDMRMYKDLFSRAIDGNQYQCGNQNIPLDGYINSLVKDWGDLESVVYIYFGTVPILEAIYLDNQAGGDYFGLQGEYTRILGKTFRDLQRFWDIQSQGIQLTDMHTTLFNDTEKVSQILQVFYGIPAAEADEVSVFLKQVLNTPPFQNGTSPVFTFNAFAIAGQDVPGFGTIASKIVMGDGILQGFQALGYGDVAPQAILAHEFAHHIQFQKGYFENGSPEDQAEATRRTELMADAYSAYFLTHKRGLAMNWKRVQQFLQVFFNIGDCYFEDAGHHGTYNQRLKAALFGYQVAHEAQKQGQILSSAAFYRLFEKKLPVLTAPDATGSASATYRK